MLDHGVSHLFRVSFRPKLAHYADFVGKRTGDIQVAKGCKKSEQWRSLMNNCFY